jgi:broad specificity phosphatase PhoE
MNLIRDPHFEAPGGESQLLVKDRMVEAIEEIYHNNQGKNIVLVSHGVAIAVAFAHYLHGDTTRWVDYTTHNTAISELCLKSSELLSFNDTEHLGDV